MLPAGTIHSFYGTLCFLSCQTFALCVPLYYLKQLVDTSPVDPEPSERLLQSRILSSPNIPVKHNSRVSSHQESNFEPRLADSYEDLDDFDPEPDFANGTSPSYARFQLHRASADSVHWIS